jgi:hypothetical protein
VSAEAPYPSIELDPIRRLHALAAAIPGAAVAERVLDAPFEAVWDVATDFEEGVPKIEIFVGSARILSREGDRLEVAVKYPIVGLTDRLDVVLRPGWCWMQSGTAVAAMAAKAEGDKTRFAHLEAFRIPGRRIFGPLLAAKIVLVRELQRIERLARERGQGHRSA